MTEFWARADVAEPVFLAAELSTLGSDLRSRLDAFKILRRSEDLDEVECDACGDGHSGRVTILIAPPGSKPRAYIWCPEVGRVSVGTERLEVQRVELDRLASAASTVLGFGSSPCSLVDDRLWLLGTAQLGAQMRDVFFSRGLSWPDGPTLADHVRLKTSACPVILVPNQLPSDSVWTENGRVILSMSEFDWFGDGSQEILPKIGGIVSGHERRSNFSEAYLFRRTGEMWSLSFRGKTVHVPDALGMGYIAELLRTPRVAIEAAQLAGADIKSTKLVAVPGIPMADETTIRAVRADLVQKQAELAGIQKSDWTRRGALQEEIPKLEKYLAEVETHQGKARKVAGTAQRSRTSVTNAINRAIDHISAQHPDLGFHLKESIKTGTTPIYAPVELPDWQF